MIAIRIALNDPIPAPDTSWQGEDLIRTRRQEQVDRKEPGTPKVRKNIAAVEDRRKKVAVMFEQGLKATDIAANLGCSHSSVRTDLIALGLW